jgi:Mn-dependent DtxR family transcriptional regulator
VSRSPRRSPARTPTAPRSEAARSESTEDHLERIHDLVERKGYARVTDIAEALGLNRSTVSNMVRRLAARGFVNYERYRGFTLTDEGKAVARDIRARHEILSGLFELLGLAPETAAQEVEDIEHHLRPQTLAVLASLVSYWRAHPEQLRAFLRFHRRNDSG